MGLRLKIHRVFSDKENIIYLMIVVITAALSFGYNITHFAIGVDDTAIKLSMEEGLYVCINRWTLFFLNRVLHLNMISWPTWLVEFLAVSILSISMSLWCFLIINILRTVGVRLSKPVCGLAVSLAISCPIISEIWVYYFHNGISIGYGFTALALMVFMKSLRHERRKKYQCVIGSGICLGVALGCYETMMDCYLIGAIAVFLVLHALSDQKKNSVYDIRFLPWLIRGIATIGISLLLRVFMNNMFKAVYQLDKLSIHGMNDYNSLFGDLFTEPGALGMLFKRLYVRYYINAVAYLPITFLVCAWLVIFAWSLYYTIKNRDLWVLVCAPSMMVIPVLSSIAGGRAKTYHSAQYVPLVIMIGFLLLALAVSRCREKRRGILAAGLVITALLGGVHRFLR